MRARVLVGLILLVGPALVPAVSGLGAPAPRTEGHERLLVSLDTWPPTTIRDAIEREGGHVEESFPETRTLLVEGENRLQTELSEVAAVSDVTPATELTPNLAPNKETVNLTASTASAEPNGTNVTVAVVNGGIDADHPGLEDRIVEEVTVTPDGVHRNASGSSRHGTHVAGILAGTGEGASPDRGDVAGVAPGVDVISLDISADFTTSNALRAFEWIEEHHEEHDIRVVLSSWGRMREPASYEADDPIVRASDELVDQGLVVVFSAGNGGPSESAMTVEATNPSVLTVGASTGTGQAASFSSRGPVMDDGEQADWTKPDLVAPGNRIVSTRATGSGAGASYLMMNGTSMAAPQVAGAAALILSERPGLAPAEVEEVLVGTARDIGEPGIDEATGAGLLDVGAALDSVGALPQRPAAEDSPALSGDADQGSDVDKAGSRSGERPPSLLGSPPRQTYAAPSESDGPAAQAASLPDGSPTQLALALLAPQLFGALIARITTGETPRNDSSRTRTAASGTPSSPGGAPPPRS